MSHSIHAHHLFMFTSDKVFEKFLKQYFLGFIDHKFFK